MAQLTETCPGCGHKSPIRMGTRDGMLVEVVSPHVCRRASPAPVEALPDESEAERCTRLRQAGLCRDCGAPVEGPVGKARRCAECRKAERKRAWKEYAQRTDVRKRRAVQQAARLKKPGARDRHNARIRENHARRMETDPEYREAYRKKKQEPFLYSSPKYERTLAKNRAHNEKPERKEYNRRRALESYYRRNPVRPSPVCRTCGESIPYHGKKQGPPPKYCRGKRECRPKRARSRTQQSKAA